MPILSHLSYKTINTYLPAHKKYLVLWEVISKQKADVYKCKIKQGKKFALVKWVASQLLAYVWPPKNKTYLIFS